MLKTRHLIKAYSPKSFIEKSKGLMFEKQIYPLFFQTRFGIHTFFVKEPLGIVVLDNSYRIKKVIKAHPWRVYLWNPFYKNVLEIPISMLQSKDLQKGQKTKIVLTPQKQI